MRLIANHGLKILTLACLLLVGGGLPEPVCAAQEPWTAELGKVRDLNEKEPVLVKAYFYDEDDLLRDTEKVFVRWEQVNRKTGRWWVMSAVCPHMKCLLEWISDDGVFRDPCYGSEFDIEGNVVLGPCREPMYDYSGLVSEEDGMLILEREPDEDAEVPPGAEDDGQEDGEGD